jgi:hypothetical protein
MDGFDRSLGDAGRKIGIAHALGKVDPTDTVTLDRHRANLGLNDKRRDSAETKLAAGGWHTRPLN